ncbi:MAG: TetR/AcrR family transcriptional regulator [Janthinobacterium lividum]
MENQGIVVGARGRRRSADPREVATLALRLFAKMGYDETTMAEIAAAAGISRQTLFRYFPAKSDIVWDRMADDTRALRAALSAVPPEEHFLDALCRVVPTSLQYDDDDLDVLREQVTILAATPAVLSRLRGESRAWTHVVDLFVAERTGRSTDDVVVRAVSDCVQAVGWTALLSWVETTESSPARLQREAYSALRDGFR